MRIRNDGATSLRTNLPLLSSAMHCYICQRPPGTHLPFSCTLCARTSLYQSRTRLAQAQLEQEAAASHAEQHLKAAQTKPSNQSAINASPDQDRSTIFTGDPITVHRSALKERTTLILEYSDHLRAEVGKVNQEIAGRRASNAKRRDELARARQELARHAAVDRGTVEKAIGRIQHRWDIVHTRTAESRLLLCKEAANLYGLQDQNKVKASRLKTYAIGGLPIFSLRNLNSEIHSVLPF